MDAGRGPGLTRSTSLAGTAVVPPPVNGGAAVPAHYFPGARTFSALVPAQLPSSASLSAVSDPGSGV